MKIKLDENLPAREDGRDGRIGTRDCFCRAFQALGTTDLVTPRGGETHKTSAASLALFDKN
jgi:hypothetical protein